MGVCSGKVSTDSTRSAAHACTRERTLSLAPPDTGIFYRLTSGIDIDFVVVHLLISSCAPVIKVDRAITVVRAARPVPGSETESDTRILGSSTLLTTPRNDASREGEAGLFCVSARPRAW